MLSMDFVTKLPESRGSDTILTVTDQGCTKAVILLPYKVSWLYRAMGLGFNVFEVYPKEEPMGSVAC